MSSADDRQSFFVRITLVMAICTVILTLSFIGVLAIIRGELSAPTSRIPWYLVVSALAFVASIVILEAYGATGREIIVTATIVGIWSFLITALSVEGIFYTVRNPEEVFVSQLVLYFLAAGLLGTGIAYWALHHWREFAGRDSHRL